MDDKIPGGKEPNNLPLAKAPENATGNATGNTPELMDRRRFLKIFTDPIALAEHIDKASAAEDTKDKKPEEKTQRRGFLRKTGKVIGWTVAVTAGATYVSNDFTTKPPVSPPTSYRDVFDTIDPKRAIGVLMINVNGEKEPWAARHVTYAARNNYIHEMKQHYGKNFIVIDNASVPQLMDFSRQFNQRFGPAMTEVHVVANHHQGHYKDTELANFLDSIQAKSKRAIIYACGPSPEPYKNSGCDYVVLPRINERMLGPEFSFSLSPAYRDLIGMVRHAPDPSMVQTRLNNRSTLEIARDKLTHEVWPRVWMFDSPRNVPDVDGTVVVPPAPKGRSR